MEDLPYRTATRMDYNDERVPLNDEIDYSTLKLVINQMEEVLTGLYRDFNAFDLVDTGEITKGCERLLIDIKVRKNVYEILSPLLEAMKDSIGKVDSLNK